MHTPLPRHVPHPLMPHPFMPRPHRKLRSSEHGQILLNMSAALLALYLVFIVAGHVTGVVPLCGLLAALLQYLMLALFGWMAVEAVHLYIKLVVVLGAGMRHFVLKAAALVWSEWPCSVLPVYIDHFIIMVFSPLGGSRGVGG